MKRRERRRPAPARASALTQCLRIVGSSAAAALPSVGRRLRRRPRHAGLALRVAIFAIAGSDLLASASQNGLTRRAARDRRQRIDGRQSDRLPAAVRPARRPSADRGPRRRARRSRNARATAIAPPRRAGSSRQRAPSSAVRALAASPMRFERPERRGPCRGRAAPAARRWQQPVDRAGADDREPRDRRLALHRARPSQIRDQRVDSGRG